MSRSPMIFGGTEPFWKAARVLLRFRQRMALALIGALIGAATFGAGLGLMLPMFHLLLGQRKTLAQMADQWLVTPSRPPVVQDLGRWLVEHLPHDPFLGFTWVMGAMLALGTIGSAGRYLHELMTRSIVFRGIQVWRARLHHRMVRAPVSHVMTTGTAGLSSRILVDTRRMGNGMALLMGGALEQLLKGATALAAAFVFNWRLALLSMVGAPLLFIVLRKFSKAIRRATRRELGQQGLMLGTLAESIGNLRVVKTHNAEGFERRRFNQLNRRLFNYQMKMRRIKALSGPLMDTLAIMGMILVAEVAAWQIFRHNVSPEVFMSVLASLALAGASFKPLSNLNNEIQESSAAAARVLEVYESMPLEPNWRDKQLTVLPRHRRSVALESVSYTYPGAASAALRDVDLEIKHGQYVAIVGGNGAGKSTLVSLLPRLIEPASGRVLIDGIDIAGVDLRSLREQMAVVTQKTVLFRGTIAQNIAYGRPHTPMDRIIAAARAAYAHDFIDALPRGYQSELGEHGEGLSGGQSQRLCIARAILRDPAILILDEATSQVDADSETKIRLALDKLRHGRTTIVIAHRLSTVINADRIVVMEDGAVVAQGTHQQLLESSPVYRTLTQMQLQPAHAAS